ncbi:Molybdenum cofactor synthesis protein cinnamon, putative [Pediculus humanus corporis]|uniref:Molybdenum cofactor synthesis protein cinnamon, putative n=1 Tax=Pediculus humanus subsp. corporis TaxID=121224 RepID=E0VI26_PEDHC|nr:Molybdenum cofactor synthesis protein cinnamon, putative [Pediculus humanus corporis]EEB13032.1 Molybdenum cofactor synthesis protein cinnamon, putative [Pediculus humanus corporis]
MEKITVGILTISDRCSRKESIDESGANLVRLINSGIVKNGVVVERDLVPDEKEEIKKKLLHWCDNLNLNLILTVGGTGIAPRDVTPEVTAPLLDKKIPGISNLIFKKSSEITPLAALSRGISGIRGKSLIVNLPGSKKASEECLTSICSVISHAVDLICDIKENVDTLHKSMNKKQSKVEVITEDMRVRRSPYACLKVYEAQKIIFDVVNKLKREKIVNLENSLDYVIAKNVLAVDHLPPFDASIKDGYAIISNDKTTPKTLLGSCAAGNMPDEKIIPGCCVSVNTGAPIPENCDAVGFDFKKNDLLMPAGTYLGSSAIGLLAAAGIMSVTVYDKPTLAVMSTGDEIVNPNEALKPGKVRDSNRLTLISMLKEEGFKAEDMGIVKDEPDSLFSSLTKAFEISDVVVTTGSMSMGDRDYLKEVLKVDFDAEIFFGAVFMKPGKPTAFALLNFQNKPKLWFGLPGNPASAVVTTHLFLLPALKNMSGNKRVLPPRVDAYLTFDIELIERPHYHRGILSYENGKFEISTTGNQSSSRVGSCLDANCLIEIPHGKGVVSSGTKVSTLIIGKHF